MTGNQEQKLKKFKNKNCPHLLSHGGYDLLEKNLMEQKMKKRLQDAQNTEDSQLIIDPLSPIARHVKWKMARTKRYGQMASKASKDIYDKIVS